MKKHGIALVTAGMVLACSGANAIIIDSFATSQTVQVTGPAANPASNFGAVSGGGIIGGERDLLVTRTTGANAVIGNDVSCGAGDCFSLSGDALTTFNMTFTYDGIDGTSGLNATGLGGLDITDGGDSDTFRLSVFSSDFSTNLTVRIYTDAGNFSQATTTTPFLQNPPGTDLDIALSSFVTAAGTGADFSNVGAIQMIFNAPSPNTDLTIDLVGTVDLLPNPPDPSPMPLPGTLLLSGGGLLALGLMRRRRR